jgi:hypothetical protein
MANTLYSKAREGFLEGQFSWTQDDYKVMLVDANYAPNFDVDQNITAVDSPKRVAGPIPLTGKTATGGAADADDSTFTSVSGQQVKAIVIYRDSGSEATSNLIAYIDTATGLPITPNGGDIIVTWDNGTNKIFRL